MKKIKTHSFQGSRYKVGNYEHPKFGGQCAAPGEKNKFIRVPMRGDTIDELEYTIHEALHACFWGVGEDAVQKSAGDIARFLWRLGWRKGEK